jgi:hypothetical protein
MLTQEYLRDVLTYEPDTGFFRWTKARSGRSKVGGIAGWRDGVGYIRIRLEKKDYKVHRLAWFYMTGKWPKNQIDHIDGDGFNNCWKNLREATNKQNQENVSLGKNNTSGYRGVYFDKSSQKWIAQVGHNRQRFYLCGFKTAEEAGKAAAEKRAELFTYDTKRDQVNLKTCQTVRFV